MAEVFWRLAASVLALWAASRLVEGVELTAATPGAQLATLALVAVLFAGVNAVVKPVVTVVSCPLYVLTLGLFTFVANGLLFWLTGAVSAGLGLAFSVTGFWPGFWGALVVSVIGWAVSLLVRD